MEKPFVSQHIDELEAQIDKGLLKKINGDEAIKYQAIPLRFNKLGFLIILTAYPENRRTLNFFKERFNAKEIIEWVVTDLDINNLVKKLFKGYFPNLTIMGL